MKKLRQKFKKLISREPSILSKLMLVIMLTVAMTLILTGVVLSINEWVVFRSISTHSISTLAGVIGSNSTAALAFQDSKVGNEILQALTSEPEIYLGCLYSKDKKLFATYVKKNSLVQCPASVPPYEHIFETGKHSYSEAVIRENENYGSLYIVSDMHNFYQRLKLYLVLLIGFILSAALVAFWIASRLQHFVTGPILRLAETARFISEEGKFSLRAEKSTEVEINSLVNAFNRMLDTIQEREEMIRQSEEQFRAAFELAAVGNVLLSTTGQFMRVNSELCKMLEYSSEELLKLKFSDITYPDDLGKSTDAYQKIFRKEFQSYSFEKRYLTKSGAILWAIVSVAPIRNSSGDVIMIISVIQDITERKRDEEELARLLVSEREARLEAEKSIQMRNDFLLIASHELRTPITPIKMHFQLMKRQVESLEPNTIPHQEYLLKAFNTSKRQLENLEKLTEDLLRVSQILAGKLVLNLKMVNLSELVREVIKNFETESQRAGCLVNFIDEPNVIGTWDKLMVEQIIVNIFTNAIKYGAGKPIDITVSKVDGKAILKVRDNGIGISKENLGKIFEKFGRVSSIKNFGGLGLGLYISKEYVSAHDGTIQVKSNLDQGSTFIVELPIEAPATRHT